ncbi:hypothetical protein P280DRAFT_179519 [Massarina eburnea CBS 473.64]|uniref:Uncharacterized protein n=1 Tax=Massarina eburnea CBS 473.64 TaxID=1395130 RepID=A0A6A6SAG9_9PLEO|nr:hypothetical protein P280DRAFT_179519 [Massarina eburnea CBS 473.64]
MSRLEVFAAVAAVVSAFHTGAELAAQIERKRWRRDSKSENDEEDERRKLQVSLETAESLIGFRYAADIDKVGDIGLGDEIARDRLFHIAVTVQTNIVRSLQLAIKHEKAVLDLSSLHQASIINRKETIDALDELKHRVLFDQPLQRTAFGPSRISRNSRGSIVSVLPSRSPTSPSHNPITVTTPASGDLNAEKTDLTRYFSVLRKQKEPSSTSTQSPISTSESINFHPALDYLLRGKNPEERHEIMKDIDELIAAYQDLAVNGDRAAALAALTGQSEKVKRDTLAVLMAGGSKGNASLHQDALELLKRLPSASGETQGKSEYPAYNHNVLDPKNDKRYSEWTKGPQPAPATSRWSDVSSVYSDHTVVSEPPSLYRHGSTSSYGSDQQPAEPPTPPRKNNYLSASNSQPTKTAYLGINRLQTSIAPSNASPRVDSCIVAPLAVRSRSTTPTNDIYAALQKPLPPIKDHDDAYHDSTKQGRGGIHLSPNDEVCRQVNASARTPKGTPTTPLNSRPVTPVSRPMTPCIVTTITTPAQEKMMGGRPCKDNNYWGFCKGAWATREELKKGFNLEARPTGMYTTSQVWQCKSCNFTGTSVLIPHPTKKNKKETIVDPTICSSSVGIRYRWAFLAKSHVKQTTPSTKPIGYQRKPGESSDCSFGCTICSVERSVSGIFGNVETLMNHIFMEHVRPGRLSSSTLKSVHCIIDRTARSDEDWDLNIPNEDTCVLLF